MLVHDLQTFLYKFTEGAKKGTNGNALSHAKLYVERDGYLEEIKRMEVHESNIIGQPGHRLVLKTQTEKKFTIADSLKKDS
jgi:hypothetical protein